MGLIIRPLLTRLERYFIIPVLEGKFDFLNKSVNGSSIAVIIIK